MPRRIRICYVINAFAIGGAETVVLDLARGLDPEIYDVTVLAVHDRAGGEEPEMRRRFRAAGVRTAAMTLGSMRNPLSLYRLWRFLRSGRFDIVHGHNRPSDAWAVTVGGWAGIPHRLWTRHLVYRDMSPRQLSRYSDISRRAAIVLAVSDAVRENCIRVEGVSPDKVTTLVNGIDTDRYRPLGAEARRAKRRDLGLAEGQRMLLFVGRLSHQKAPDAFVRLIWSLREERPEIRGFVCGGGPLAADLATMVAGGPGGVDLLGFRGDVPALLGASDLFVSTSRNEGLPLNMMEAMSCAAPFVGPDIPQVSCLFAGEASLRGRLYAPPPLEGDVPAGTLAAWRDRIIAALDDPMAVAVGNRGREIIRGEYSLGRMIERHHEIYLSFALSGN